MVVRTNESYHAFRQLEANGSAHGTFYSISVAKVECPSFSEPRGSALSFRMHTTKIIAHAVLRVNDLIGAAIGVVLGQQKDIRKNRILCEIRVRKHVA